MSSGQPWLYASVALLCCACATLSENECRGGDWRQIGYQDGLRGHAMSRLVEHQNSCAEHGVGADTTAWKLGYVEGQARYCTASNGYLEGRLGRAYAEVCPPETDDAFRPAYADGRRTADMLAALESTARQLDALESVLAEDDRRSQFYLDAARSGRKPVDGPPLMGRDERRRAEHDYEDLRHHYRHLRENLERRDDELSARYAVEPLLTQRYD